MRVLGIDTPETRDPDVGVECGGPEATSWMFFLAFTAAQDTNGDQLLDRKGGAGVKVKLRTDRSQDIFDSFGRVLAYIDVPAGKRGAGVPAYDLGRSVIVSGFSRAYTFKRHVKRYASYRDAEQEARTANRGVWAQCGGNFHSGS